MLAVPTRGSASAPKTGSHLYASNIMTQRIYHAKVILLALIVVSLGSLIVQADELTLHEIIDRDATPSSEFSNSSLESSNLLLRRLSLDLRNVVRQQKNYNNSRRMQKQIVGLGGLPSSKQIRLPMSDL